MRQLVPKNVLAATDLAPGSGDAIRAAAALAALAGARLRVVHASRDGPDAEGALREHVRRSAPRAAEGAVLAAPAGTPHEVVLHAARRAAADVIVLGPHRPGGGGLGSTADRVVRGAGAPCLVVPRPLDLRCGGSLPPSSRPTADGGHFWWRSPGHRRCGAPAPPGRRANRAPASTPCTW